MPWTIYFFSKAITLRVTNRRLYAHRLTAKVGMANIATTSKSLGCYYCSPGNRRNPVIDDLLFQRASINSNSETLMFFKAVLSGHPCFMKVKEKAQTLPLNWKRILHLLSLNPEPTTLAEELCNILDSGHAKSTKCRTVCPMATYSESDLLNRRTVSLVHCTLSLEPQNCIHDFCQKAAVLLSVC